MNLVVGLGNPGKRYARTRHNIGFGVVARLAERWGFDPGARNQFGCLVGDGLVANARVTVAQPQKFMNLSGQPVHSLAGYFKIPAERVLVAHDDMQLPFGAVVCKLGGGHSGHNGLRDIAKHMGPEFVRIRCGVGRPPEGWDPADFVLGKWSADELPAVPGLVDAACDAIETILRDGLDLALQQFDTRAAKRASNPSKSLFPGAAFGAPRSAQ